MNGRSKLKDIYTNRIDNGTLAFTKEIETREELDLLGFCEGGKIDWEAFDRVKKQTQEEIENFDFSTCKQINHYKTPKYVYRYSSRRLLEAFPTTKECAEVIGIDASTIYFYASKLKPFLKRDLLISDRMLTDEDFNNIELRKTKKKSKCYVFSMISGNLLGTFQSGIQASLFYGLHPSTAGFYMLYKQGIYKPLNIIFSKENKLNETQKENISIQKQ